MTEGKQPTLGLVKISKPDRPIKRPKTLRTPQPKAEPPGSYRWVPPSALRAQGKPSRLEDADLVTRIISQVLMGVHPRIAAGAAGVSDQTWWSWMKTAEADIEGGFDSIYRRFAEDVVAAERQAEATAVLTVRTSLYGKPEAGLKYLGLRHRERWSAAPEVAAIQVNIGLGQNVLNGADPELIAALERSVLPGDPVPGGPGPDGLPLVDQPDPRYGAERGFDPGLPGDDEAPDSDDAPQARQDNAL